MPKTTGIRWESASKERERYRQVLTEVEEEKEANIARARELKRERDQLLSHVMALLNEAKESGHFSLADLKRRTGIDRSTLSKLLIDPSSNPTLSTLNRIASALGNAWSSPWNANKPQVLIRKRRPTLR